MKPLHPDDSEALHPIVVKEEPLGYKMTLEEIKIDMAKREGWTFWDDERLIGAVTLSSFTPELNVIIHAVIDSDYKGKWLTRRHLNQVFSYIFIDLGIRRVTGFAIPFVTTDAAKLLTAMGFDVEGVMRCGVRSKDGDYLDLVTYGLLKEDCPWIMEKKDLLEWMRRRRNGGANA